MERKVGEVFNDGNDVIKVVPDNNLECRECYYYGKGCSKNSHKNQIAGFCLNGRQDCVKFIKIGERKMNEREELQKGLEEEKQRAKDSLANVEKMKKQLEELNKKEEQPTVSATGVILNSDIYEKRKEKWYFYRGTFAMNFADMGESLTYFETKKQAEQESLRREGQEFIRRCAMLWNKGNDWRKDSQKEQYHIYRNSQNPKGDLIVASIECFSSGIVFFDTKELAEKCIHELNSKYNNEQIKTIFGVI